MNKTTTVIVSIMLTITLSTTVLAKSVKDLKEKQNTINNNIEQKNSAVKDKKNTMAQIQAEIDKLDAELLIAMKELTDINNQLDVVTKELEQANKDLEKAREEKIEQQEVLQTRIRYMYEYGEVTYFDALLSSDSFSDFVNRLEYIKLINEFDEEIYENLEKKEQEIQDLVKRIEDKKAETEVLQKAATDKKNELQANVNQKDALVKQIESDISLLEQQIAAEEKANKDVEAMIQAELKRQEEAARKQSASGSGSSSGYIATYTGNGQFAWPAPTLHTVNSPFGYRIHPITGKSKLHAGIDIPVGIGSPVVAAESGTVMTAGYVQGYGTTVIISHGSGLTTLYGHLSSLKVSVGQSVNRGDTVALSGNTGNSTGPHLHFEVRQNGSVVNPMGYVN